MGSADPVFSPTSGVCSGSTVRSAGISSGEIVGVCGEGLAVGAVVGELVGKDVGAVVPY